MSEPQKKADRTLLTIILGQLIVFNLAVYLACPRRDAFPRAPVVPPAAEKMTPPPPQEAPEIFAPAPPPASSGAGRVSLFTTPRLKKKAVEDYLRGLEQEREAPLTGAERAACARTITRKFREMKSLRRHLDATGIPPDQARSFEKLEAGRLQDQVRDEITRSLRSPGPR